ncbi:ABC transporter substrate-binding protein [Microbacterium phosphatis]|uniref:ABC transporter substrate-binding protein n=1 Tax=Microbacterium phosphatis TaxID=3140248 RepID=UPI0031401E01
MALVLALTGCSGGSASDDTAAATDPNATLRVNWGIFPETWAPGSQSMEPGYMRVPYETLVLREADGTILPNLATEWEFGEGATSLTLQLRDDVLFHDGTPFDAEAVKTNLEYVRDVVGGQFGGPLGAVTDVVVDDDYTVTFQFARPWSTFLDLLSQRNLPIGSPAAIEDGSIETVPVGTGPWAYDEASSVPGTRIGFTKFDDYWGEFPPFANIQLYAIPDDTAASAAVIGGEIDVTDTEDEELPRLEADPSVEYFEYNAIRNNVVFFDRGEGGVFEDPTVRQALCYAMGPQVEADLRGGEPQSQHFVEGEPGHNPDITGYGADADLDKALELWDEAGNPTIEAVFPAAPFNKGQIEVMAEQMNELPGVNITVQELAPPQFISTWNSGQYPLGLGNHAQITPADWYGAWFSETAGGNPAKVASDELKELATAAQQGGGEEAWAAVTKQIADEALTCSHMVGFELIAYNTTTVANVEPATQGWEQNLIDYRTIAPAS